MIAPSLPPNSFRRGRLPFKPRRMLPVHLEDKTKKGEIWTLDLVMIPMSSIRKMFKFEKIEHWDNLEIWADSLGEALYNPLWMRIQTLEPHQQIDVLIDVKHPYIELISGHRRIRVLEAYDFNFVYVYLWIGPWEGFPNELRPFTDVNNRAPALSSRYHKVELVYPEPI